MHTIYTLRYPENTPTAGIVFYIGYDNDWKQEAQHGTHGRLSSHTSRIIHYLWRNHWQPVYTRELETDDPVQAKQQYNQLLTRHAGPKLTNKKRVGV